MPSKASKSSLSYLFFAGVEKRRHCHAKLTESGFKLIFFIVSCEKNKSLVVIVAQFHIHIKLLYHIFRKALLFQINILHLTKSYTIFFGSRAEIVARNLSSFLETPAYTLLFSWSCKYSFSLSLSYYLSSAIQNFFFQKVMDWKPPLGHNSMSVCSQYFSIASSLVRDFVIKNQFG